MNNYPQYIYPPTTVPVQRYFANPYVYTNEYAWGGAPSVAPTLDNPTGVSGVSGGQWMGIGDKIDVGVGKTLGKIGIKTGGSPITGLGGGVLGAVGDGLYNVLGGKNKTGFGNALNTAAKFVNFIPGVGKLAGLALNGIGAFINRGWGSHRNAAGINAFNADTNAMNQTRVTDSSNESIANQVAAQNWGGSFTLSDMGETGWFNKGKFEDEFNRIMRSRASGQNYMAANYDNASTNVQKNMMNNLLMNSAAYGGYFDNPFSHPGSGAVAYGFEQQNLANQQQMLGQMQAQQMQQQQPNQPQQYSLGGCMPFCFGGKFFADGGDMNSHGADFTNGLVYIENGGTHEENPYQGVPMGYDSQGTPNVVEEDEVIAPKRLLGNGGESDFVFSNRIPIPDEFAEKYHFPYGISFSDAVKRFTKESREVPNDVIYENTNKKFLAEARDLQEQIKAEQGQQQMAMAQQAFQQLPPEQQQAMAQQAMQQEQMQAMQEQAPEAGMMQPGTETFQPSIGAFGGNLYGAGGYFGPVNSFAEKGDIKRGNRVLPEFVDTGEPWAATTGQQLMKQLKAELASADGNPLAVEEIFNKYNELWKLAEAAKMADYRTGNYLSSDEIDALQDKFGELGLNSGITDELFAKYFDPEYQAGKTTDNAANGYKKDGVAGDITGFLRNLGIGNIPEATAKELNDLAEQYGYRYFKPDDSEYWRFGNLYDENFSNEGNYIGPKLNDTQSVTEEQLNEAEGKPSDKYAMPWLSTAGRDLPIWEAGLARLLDDIGLGTKPDYSYADSLAALANTSNGYMPVSYKPVGQYITPALFDPYQPLLNADAQYGQASRAVQDNSNGNAAMANASQVALGRNAMMANGAIAETGQKFNADQKHAAADFGRITDSTNSQGDFSAQAHNAENWAQNRNMYAYRMGEALAARKAEKDATDAVILNNRKMFTDAIAKKAKENMYYNMVNHHPAYGGYGMDPRTGGILYQGHFDDGTPYWGNPGQGAPSMATNPYVANHPFNFGSFLNGLFNPYA